MQFSILENKERQLISGLKSRAVFSHMKNGDVDFFKRVLLQRRFLSFEFTRVYDYLIDAIDQKRARSIARLILRDEYPNVDFDGSEPSHREDLFADLLAIGLSKEEIFTSLPTLQTEETIKATNQFVCDILREPEFRELKAISMLRFWGEVLTSVEYECFWESGLNRFLSRDGGQSLPKSEFYIDHLDHDRKEISWEDLNIGIGATTHSDKLAKAILPWLKSEAALQAVIENISQCCELKTKFYDQFNQ